jgi:hypothetical protein
LGKRKLSNNVTAEQFEEYLTVFHEVLRKTAEEYLPREARSELRHLKYMPCKVIGYVSTQMGVAFEYVSKDAFAFEVARDIERVFSSGRLPATVPSA